MPGSLWRPAATGRGAPERVGWFPARACRVGPFVLDVIPLGWTVCVLGALTGLTVAGSGHLGDTKNRKSETLGASQRRLS